MKYFTFFAALLTVFILPDPGHTNPVKEAYTEVTLMASSSELNAGETVQLGLRFRMDPGWHVYWRNPGDSGLPPKAEWALPDGFSITSPQWPYPHTLDEEGLTTYGYDGEVTLLYGLTVPQDHVSGSTLVSAEVSWLACEVICVPGKAELSLEFPVSDSRYVISSNDLTDLKHKLPLSSGQVRVEVYESGEAFILFYPTERKIDQLEFFAGQSETIDHAAAQILTPVDGGYTLTVLKSDVAEGGKANLEGLLYSPDGFNDSGYRSALINAPIQPASSFEGERVGTQNGLSIPLAAFFAFLGGLILNLMPCVLPVLSIKVLSLVKQAGEDKAKVLAHGVTFAAGIVSMFWFLAGLLIFLRYSGIQVGWGFQFQSPLFLILMAYLFFGFGLNLFGIFEVGVGLTRLSGQQHAQGSLKGSFLNGVLATVVATPCTAPFMGSALGFAVTQPTAVALIVFTFLGVGMAFPYILLSVFPGWLKYVPKPGAWMVKLKQFFGFLMMATSVWLVWVLGVQRGLDAVTVLLFGYVGFALAAWIFGSWVQSSTKGPVRAGAWISAIIIALVAVVWPVKSAYDNTPLSAETQKPSEGFYWEPYSLEIIQSSLNNGRPVFVDFTASWCLTCQVNKKTSLNHPEVRAAFEQKNVVAVKADWSNYDERITRALDAFGKTSIPVYALYSPEDPANPVFLPEILTPDIVKRYLAELE